MKKIITYQILIALAAFTSSLHSSKHTSTMQETYTIAEWLSQHNLNEEENQQAIINHARHGLEECRKSPESDACKNLQEATLTLYKTIAVKQEASKEIAAKRPQEIENAYKNYNNLNDATLLYTFSVLLIIHYSFCWLPLLIGTPALYYFEQESHKEYERLKEEPIEIPALSDQEINTILANIRHDIQATNNTCLTQEEIAGIIEKQYNRSQSNNLY